MSNLVPERCSPNVTGAEGLAPIQMRTQDDYVDYDGLGQEVVFFSGNPLLELTEGVLHLYKHDKEEDDLIVCMVSVPNTIACQDLVAFIAPCHAHIEHIRVIRNSSPNHYMVLLTFRNFLSVVEFHAAFNEVPFSTLEPDILCKVARVACIEWGRNGLRSFDDGDPPICSVCLERMDKSADVILTILCNHSFHANCLKQWNVFTCPICRCPQSPEAVDTSKCEICDRDDPDVLWICLVCGHVGCGRYQEGHAAGHFQESGHSYALQLSTQRVWDYKGDDFVSRLLQNKVDGKIVAIDATPSNFDIEVEKIDSLKLEFTYMLTTELKKSRHRFEKKLAQLENRVAKKKKMLQEKLSALIEENAAITKAYNSLTGEKVRAEEKVNCLMSKLTKIQSQIAEEKKVGKLLQKNQSQWRVKVRQLEEKCESLKNVKKGQIGDLREQVEDLAFYIRTKKVVDTSDEREDIAKGTVMVPVENAKRAKTKHKDRKKK